MTGECHPRLADDGHPGRTPAVLARERNLWSLMAAEVHAFGQPGRPGPEIDQAPPHGDGHSGADAVVTVELVEQALGAPEHAQAGAFLAGRCEAAADASERLDAALRGFIDIVDATDPGSRAIAFVEAAMALVLRGHADEGGRLLKERLAAGRPSMADWLAAFYLAQLGDPSGYPTLVRLLDAPDGFTRLMAARHAIGFLPYDGRDVQGHRVDVVGLLRRALDDDDQFVSREIPGLLAEAEAAAA